MEFFPLFVQKFLVESDLFNLFWEILYKIWYNKKKVIFENRKNGGSNLVQQLFFFFYNVAYIPTQQREASLLSDNTEHTLYSSVVSRRESDVHEGKAAMLMRKGEAEVVWLPKGKKRKDGWIKEEYIELYNYQITSLSAAEVILNLII